MGLEGIAQQNPSVHVGIVRDCLSLVSGRRVGQDSSYFSILSLFCEFNLQLSLDALLRVLEQSYTSLCNLSNCPFLSFLAMPRGAFLECYFMRWQHSNNFMWNTFCSNRRGWRTVGSKK